MKVLVIGLGGREHALVWKLAQSPLVSQVFCAPGNAGTAIDGVNVEISSTDIPRLVKFALQEKIDLSIVGPEAPLVLGIVDAFQAEKLRIFGPTKAAAQLEGSKSFAKDIMRAANVPTADYRVFRDPYDAQRYIEDREECSLVVKASGLASGKGVIVCQNREEAISAVKRMMLDREFGDAANEIVIEERLEGTEVSILALVDSRTIVTLEPAQDHKAAYDGDRGPNTGGMGAFSPAPWATPDFMDKVIQQILIPTVHTMKKRNTPFHGVLYAGLMITAQGPKVLEFNVRFGDPEAQPVLMRLKSDLAQLLLAAADGKLSDFRPLEWDPRPAICVVMAADGYPGKYPRGQVIRGLDDAAKLAQTKVFHAGTTQSAGQVVTDGGRVLGVTSIGSDIFDAKRLAYEAVRLIKWEGCWCRKDISDKTRPRI